MSETLTDQSNIQPIKTHYRACNICEALCGLKIEYQGDQILSIKGDKNDPLSKGHICPKGVALQDIHYDPDRLKQPIKKIAGGWEKISWDQAFDEVVEQIVKTQEQFGHDAVATYAGNPTVHNLAAMLYMPIFSKLLKSKNRYSATSVDQLPEQLVAYLMFGHPLLVPVPDIDRTDCLLIIGANPVVSNGSLMTAPKVVDRLKAIQKRAGQVINIDPRFTETSKLADQHIYINPGSDVYLLLAMLNQVFANKLTRLNTMTDHLLGLDEVKALCVDYSPDAVSMITGIDAEQIRNLVQDFCAANRACCYGRIGASTQIFGTLTQWLINVFNIVTGNFDQAGGIMFTTPAADILAAATGQKNNQKFARYHSRIRKLPEFAGELPVAALAEEIQTPGDGQIKMLITQAGNPVLSTPNADQMNQALDSLDYMVAVDFYVNETTRHANIILPPTSTLERNHYDIVFHTLAVQDTAKYSEALFKPEANSMDDKNIYMELWYRLFTHGMEDKQQALQWKNQMLYKGEDGMLDDLLKNGPYAKAPHHLSLNIIKQAKHGIDLGALKPCMPQRLFTKDKKIHLISPEIKQDLVRLANNFAGYQKNEPSQYILIGRRDPRSHNSWMHNYHRLIKGKNRCTALVHHQDAADNDLADGDLIKVSSKTGELEIAVKLTDQIKTGIISIPHGWGHEFDDSNLSLAKTKPGVNMNKLTDNMALDELSGNAILSGIPVSIKKIVK